MRTQLQTCRRIQYVRRWVTQAQQAGRGGRGGRQGCHDNPIYVNSTLRASRLRQSSPQPRLVMLSLLIRAVTRGGGRGGGRWVCMTCVCAFYSLWHERWWACPPSLSTASSATPSSVWEMTRQKHRQSIVMFYIWFKSDYVSGLPITLLQQVAFLLTAKLFVPLQLVHTVAPLLTLGVLCKPQTHIFNTKADFIRTLFLKKKNMQK